MTNAGDPVGQQSISADPRSLAILVVQEVRLTVGDLFTRT